MSLAAQEAMRLAAMGYRVFPCHWITGDGTCSCGNPACKSPAKHPLTKNGCLDATTDEDVIAGWFADAPGANLAVSTDGLLVVDTDPLPDGSVNTWTAEVASGAGFAAGAGSHTPRGGTHYWFRQKPGDNFRNTASELAKRVDTRANGGYVLVFPSRTKDGAYQWMQEFGLRESPVHLPEPPDWMRDRLAGRTSSERSVRPEHGGGEQIIEGGRNTALASQGGYLRRNGATYEEVLNHIRYVNITRCCPPLDDDEVRNIAWSVSRYAPDQVTQILMNGIPEISFYSEEIEEIPDPGPLPVRFLRPPGLMGRLIDWNLSTAPKPQPELALAGAIALMAVLIGRKCEDQAGSRTNLYMIGLCGSGGGKDHARKCNKGLLEAAGYGRLVGPEAFKSDSGIVHMIQKQNPVLCHVDEFGRYLEAVKHGSTSSPHVKGIETVLLRMFTDARSTYHGDAYADNSRNITINQPHLVIYGTSVPESFWNGMSRESITDGFCGRLMIIEATNNDPDKQEDARPTEPPPELVEMARWWGDYIPGGNLSDMNPQPRVLEYSEEAKKQFRLLEDVVKAKKKEGSPYCTIYSRSGEKAAKLAMIYQLSRDCNSTVIDCESAEWGCSLTRYLHSLMEHKADLHITASRHDACCKTLLRVLKANGGSLTRRQLELGMRSAGFNPREVMEASGSLHTAGQLEAVKQVDGAIGRPQKVWRLPGSGVTNENLVSIMTDAVTVSMEES